MKPAIVIAIFVYLLLTVFSSTCLAAEGFSTFSLSYFDGGVYPLAAALAWDWEGYAFSLGWRPLDWGPAPGGDLSFAPTRGHFMLYMAGDFTGMELIPPFHWEQAYILLEPRGGMDRYMIARRYQVEAGPWELGYVEAALLSGEFSPWYLNPYPLIPLEVTQLVLQYLGDEGGGNLYCNMVMAIDVRYNGDRCSPYISLYVDDLPPTGAWNSHYKVGLQTGLEFAEPFGLSGMKLWLDYTALARHVYSYWTEWPQGDYVDGALLLGHPLGPDADLLTGRLTWTGTGAWVEMQRERHGEGRFPDPMDDVSEQTFELLTGIVETSYWIRVGQSFSPLPNLTLDLALGGAYVTNLDNVEGETGGRLDLNAKIAYEF